MKKNVLLVIPFLGYTGAERVIFTLLNNLDRDKLNLHLLIYRDDADSNPLLKRLKKDVIVSSINFKGRFRYNIHNIIWGIKSACKEYKIDSVLISDGSTNASIAPFLSFMSKGKIKFIARESNLPSLYEKSKVVKLLYRYFYRKYNAIIAQSNDMVNDLTLKMDIPNCKITKINNPIDIDFIKDQIYANPEFILPTGKINLLAIGRLTFQKGFDLLLSAFASLSNKEKHHLTIVGTGEELDGLTLLASTLKIDTHVTFIAKVDNPYAIMRQANAFISSSRWEGYPNVVMESIVCGLPVLANNYPGGINEIINSKNGVICDIENNFEKCLKIVLNLENVHLDSEYNNKIYNQYQNIF